MSTISHLPKSTTQLLGSSLVIITPVSLVKELLDNSIDAKATSIEILISSDTVKKIEVRDNGLGIHPDDYDALGKRSHTSKIRTYDDLKLQSGKTLGFRGEALASVNTFGTVTITTKIASEPVAAILHIIPEKGGVSKQRPISAPVGTTVSVTGLFGRLPVREQMATKTSAKTIDMIQELLRSYAMARPQVRLSFKVLQSPKQNWSYSPKLGASVREAAIQLFGTELANQCIEKTFEMTKSVNKNALSMKHQELPLKEGYVFEAFIPKPESDPSRIPKHRYFSIDGRPIIARKGTMKKLLGVYTEHLSVTCQSSSTAKTPKDCFIRLNIKCPPGSYDVNIEPSKDEILFSDEQIIVDGFKNLCKEVYGDSIIETPNSQLGSGNNLPPEKGNDIGSQVPPNSGFEAEPDIIGTKRESPSLQTRSQITSGPGLSSQFGGRQVPLALQAQPNSPQELSPDIPNLGSTAFNPIILPILSSQDRHAPPGAIDPKDESPSISRKPWNIDMSTDYNERFLDNRSNKRRAIPNHHEDLNVVEPSTPQDMNPWVIAKMNANAPNTGITNGPLPQENSAPFVFEPPVTPEPPILRHPMASPRDLDFPTSRGYLPSPGNIYPSQPTVPGRPFRNPMHSPQEATIGSTMPPPLKSHRRYDLPWSPPSSAPRPVASNEHLVDSSRPASDNMKQTTISFGATGSSQRKRRRESGSENAHLEYLGEEQLEGPRQAHPRRNLRRKPSQPKAPCRQQASHYDRVTRKIPQDQSRTRLHPRQDQIEGCSTSKIEEPIRTTLSSDDPRAYLLRRQKSKALEDKGEKSKKIRRLKSSLLPLETIPNGNEVHYLALVEAISTEALQVFVGRIVLYDKYMKGGMYDSGLEMNLSEGREIEARLKAMLHTQDGEAGGGEAEPEINLCALLKGKGVAARA